MLKSNIKKDNIEASMANIINLVEIRSKSCNSTLQSKCNPIRVSVAQYSFMYSHFCRTTFHYDLNRTDFVAVELQEGFGETRD